MATYTTQLGQQTLLAAEIGRGGEGIVSRVHGHPDLVAKVFNAKALANPYARRESKLRVMVATPPIDEMKIKWRHHSFAWPVAMLYGSGNFCGYLMPRIENAYPIFNLYSPRARTQVPVFKNFTWQSLHAAATNLAIAVNALHHKQYVFGDVNEGNILVNRDALITFLDTDSFQVTDRSNPKNPTVYRCLVGRPEFTPPELQGVDLWTVDRNEHHDAFGLAILIFQLLMEGNHPFSGVPLNKGSTSTTLINVKNIKNGVFPFAGNSDYVPPPHAPSYSVLHPELRRLFETCFVTGHGYPALRPSPLDWARALDTARLSLVQCSLNSSHWYGNHLNACPWCERNNQLSGKIPIQVPIRPAPQPSPPPSTAVPPPPRPTPTPVPPPSPGFPFARVAVGFVAAFIIFFGFRTMIAPPTPEPTPIMQVATINGGQAVATDDVVISTRTPRPQATQAPTTISNPTRTRRPVATNPPTSTEPPLPTRTPRPSPLPASPIRSLQLVNADRNRSVQTLGNNVTIDLSDMGTRNLNIKIDVSSPVGSVYFLLDGRPLNLNGRSLENTAPYYVAGDANGVPHSWDWSSLIGSHTLEIVPCTEINAGGTCGPPFVINFTVRE